MIICGDSLTELRKLSEESVHCCVTSPPYWGLRDYGCAGQLGLERTPEEYVAHLVDVFREVRRVLRKDGTLWLVIGDSYAGSNQSGGTKNSINGDLRPNSAYKKHNDFKRGLCGIKPKDLVGIPWRVAFALQQPYYTGRISREQDRIWLAAMIDGEGCMFIHKRRAGQSNGQGYERKNDSYGAGLEVANCHESIVQRCLEIVGQGSICHQDKEGRFKNRNQRLFRWNLRSNECRGVIREIYPYLTAKQHEARLLLGCPSSGQDAERAHAGLMNLHNGFASDIDFPAPASMFEQGFYLRQDVIWQKPNPMPESVRDRCTKAHEYIFMLTKSQKYYYDAEAVKEPATESTIARISQPNLENQAGSNRVPGKTNGPMKAVIKKQDGTGNRTYTGFNGRYFSKDSTPSRNRRSVWTITTKPFKEAHFATFPPDLVEPMIKAGTSERGCCPECGVPVERKVSGTFTHHNGNTQTAYGEKTTAGRLALLRQAARQAGGEYANIKTTIAWESGCSCSKDPVPCTVLDPFFGAGTTGLVAKMLGRDFIGIELNQKYCDMAERRINQVAYEPELEMEKA